MNPKEQKALIKEIRESIKAGSNDIAINKCQSLLKADAKSHTAYLLLGAAYQNTNKSEAAKNLRRAVEYASGVAPTVVALHGLLTVCEQTELPGIYEQLLEYAPEKQAEYYEKLYATASNNEKVLQECFRIFKQEFNKKQNTEAMAYLAKLWYHNDIAVAADEHDLYKTAMELLIAQSDSKLAAMVYKQYLKWLYKQRDYASCIRNACNMIEQHPNDVYAYEWICKIYCETYQQGESFKVWQAALKAPIETYAATLKQLDSKSGLAMLITCIELYAQQQFVSAREMLLQVLQVLPNFGVAIELLADTHIQLGAHRLALPLLVQLGKVQSDAYAQCLSYESTPLQLNKAVQLLEDELPKSDSNLIALARCYYKLGSVSKLNALHLNDYAKAEFLLQPKDALKLLENISETSSFEVNLLRGKLYWQLEDYNAALSNVLQATRIKPYNAECFDYLGRIYAKTGDMVRARKCYEKCINLNALSEEAVTNLSNIYQQLEEEELNEALLLNTLEHLNGTCAIRIHYKLGLHYLQVKKWDNAVQSFRTAIKHDAKCMIYWESLGDAYVARGSYHSAIRVFQKIIEMSPENIYAQLQIALIQTAIRMYPEAIENFEALLKQHPDYLPGLKGAAEAHIGLANNLKANNLMGRAKQHLQLAVNYLQSVILKGNANDAVWLWRLTANVFLKTALLPPSLANLDVDGSLAKREERITLLMRKDLLHLAVRFYTCALKLKQNTYLWYELALCSYYNAIYIPEEEQQHLSLAERACKIAIKEQSNRWQNWNLFGVINMHKTKENLPLAQHCFIQALELERKSYTSWTNLGVLYLKLKEIKLANQAFQRAQQSSPIYANAWIGQAMIAEEISEEAEAMDLFRHCQQFDNQLESSIGYAHWVCTILSNPELCLKPHYKHAIEHMYADTVALDAIDWYVRTEEQDSSIAALTFQAFLCVRKKLYHLALAPMLQATKLASPGADRDKLYTNLGYLYLQLKKPELAINAFNMVSHVTFKPIIGLALAYYRSGQLAESYSVYNSVLSSITDTEGGDKAANILVAMASMVYEYQGEVDTKTILYQCILLKNSPIQALFSACALGILHQDNQLTETILNQLKMYDHSEQYCTDIAYITAQYYLINQQPRKALNYLLSRAHMFPRCASLRQTISSFLLDNFSEEKNFQVPTSQMALSALVLSHRDVKIKCDVASNVETLLIASRALKPIDFEKSKQFVQRAMHLQPQNRLTWLPLLNAVH